MYTLLTHRNYKGKVVTHILTGGRPYCGTRCRGQETTVPDLPTDHVCPSCARSLGGRTVTLWPSTPAPASVAWAPIETVPPDTWVLVRGIDSNNVAYVFVAMRAGGRGWETIDTEIVLPQSWLPLPEGWDGGGNTEGREGGGANE